MGKRLYTNVRRSSNCCSSQKRSPPSIADLYAKVKAKPKAQARRVSAGERFLILILILLDGRTCIVVVLFSLVPYSLCFAVRVLSSSAAAAVRGFFIGSRSVGSTLAYKSDTLTLGADGLSSPYGASLSFKKRERVHHHSPRPRRPRRHQGVALSFFLSRHGTSFQLLCRESFSF